MSRRNVPIADATIDELRAFANEMAITVPKHPQTKPETIIEALAKVWSEDYIVVEEKADLRNPEAVKTHFPGEKIIWVELQTQDTEGGDQPVFASVNGWSYLMPRGERIGIPAPYYEVLKNAQMDVYDYDAKTGIKAKPRKVPRFPFSVHAGPETL